MKIFPIPTREQLAQTAPDVTALLLKTQGFMPNLYAAIGNSPNALKAYFQFTGEQARGTFHAKEREAIFLIVSELNGCNYCLASHTKAAVMIGWSEDETMQLRGGTYPDPRWQIIYQVISSVIVNKGSVNDDLLDTFYQNGYSEAALIDLLSLIMVMTFTNYAYHLTRIPIDFPQAKPL